MNMYTSNFAPDQTALQQQAAQAAPSNQMGYQQQLAQALKAQPFTSSTAPDLSGVNSMLQSMLMQKMMQPEPPATKPPAAPAPPPIADAGITNNPMLTQYGSMLA